MANAKIILDTRREKSDGSFNVVIRVAHFKKVYTINSGVSVVEKYWNEKNSEVTKVHPNSQLMNLKVSKNFYLIQQAILKLEDDFSIENLRNLIDGKNQREKNNNLSLLIKNSNFVPPFIITNAWSNSLSSLR